MRSLDHEAERCALLSDDTTLAELAAVAGLVVASALDEAATLLALRPVAGDMD